MIALSVIKVNEQKKTPHRQQGSRKILDDSPTVQNILSFADSVLEEWRPYLLTEGDMLLGRELSINRAIIHQLQNAVATKATTYDQLLKKLSEIKAENEQLKFNVQLKNLRKRINRRIT